MATLDDKLLGEKLHYYCSSSEDEAGSDDENDTKSGSRSGQASGSSATFTPSQPWDGSSANTGPKGVLKDWQRYKQLETEMRYKPFTNIYHFHYTALATFPLSMNIVAIS